MITYDNRLTSELLEKLETSSTISQLPGAETSQHPALTNREINTLTGYASILSLSEKSEEKILCYEITTRLIELCQGKNPTVTHSADIIMSRLGNFPARSLLRKRYGEIDKTPTILRLECLSREIENSIFIDNEKQIKLTDFQHKFYKALQEEKALSISAPTSAGKSFILGLSLINKLKSSYEQCMIYIVPTRALISEVSLRIRDLLREHDLKNINVSTVPFPLSNDSAEENHVYVLTQERLINYLGYGEKVPKITYLIVDEAHEIQNGKRGILLQSAIDIVIQKFPSVEILFASPLIRNPGYFFSIFNLMQDAKYFTETISPVSQNIILISEVVRKPREINCDLLVRKKTISLGVRKIDFDFRGGKATQKALFALSVSKENKDSVIVFSNGPADAESVALELSKNNKGYTASNDVLLFIDFLKKEIHPEYPLIECLENGIGFHYGKMPSVVRSNIESLFKNEDIKYICCTSTLLQGVNLPAKHIIIENPKSGDDPMSRSDFLNLSGRAGRLLKEFHGNIWCIRPSTWANKSFEGERLQEISSAISSVMADGGIAIKNMLTSGIDDSFKDETEMAFSKIYQDYIQKGASAIKEEYKNSNNETSLEDTINCLSNLKIELPISILEQNNSVRPDQLQRLYSALKNTLKLDNYTPLHPYSKGAKGIMENIIDLFIEHFNWKLTPKYKNTVSHLAYEWMRGTSLNDLLAKRVAHMKKSKPDTSVSSSIRDYVSILDGDVRFKLVKYFCAFNDILSLVKEERGVFSDELEPYHVYLELGASDKTALNIMATGLSRFTALYLSKSPYISKGLASADDYYKHLSQINLNLISMPLLCKKEIQKMYGFV